MVKLAPAKDLKKILGILIFYRAILPHVIDQKMIIQDLITGNKKNDVTLIQWTSKAEQAFERCKMDLSSSTLLFHPVPEAKLITTHQITPSDRIKLRRWSCVTSRRQQTITTLVLLL